MDDPDLSRLLENNEAPLETAIHRVKAFLEEPRKELHHIQAEIHHLNQLLTDLKEKEQTTQKTIISYNRILSPARRVPSDIWNEIFYHCLPTQRNPFMSTAEAPMLLARVCSTWRFTALSSPRLWARLHIPFACCPQETSVGVPEQHSENRRQYFAREMKHRSEGVKYWLSRSGTCPISLSVICTSHNWAPSTSQSQWEAQTLFDIFNAVLPFASRWNDLELCMPSDIYRKLDMMLSVDMVPMLRCLRASLRGQGPQEHTLVLLQAPNLRKISLDAPRLSPKFTTCILPLTYLSLYSLITHKHAFMLLDKCPNLIHCKLVVDTMDEVFAPPSTLSLPHLKSLCVEDSGRTDDSKAFLRYINAPNLKWIDYQRHPTSRHGWVMNFPSPILSLMERSTFITKLTFDPCGVSTRDISECFRLAPHIRHLVVGPEPSGPSRIISRQRPRMRQRDNFNLTTITVKETRKIEKTRLPRLEIIEASLMKNFSDDDLLKFIVRRLDHEAARSGIAILKCVRMTFDRPRERDIAPDVDLYAKAAGIDFKLELTYHPGPPSVDNPLSPSFGISEDGLSWNLPDIDEASVLAL
ncbi:hypothetical protein BDZ97DRAFT_1065416 [Flammula alnicola]|nr:hypothetical protein BDZ97DRAFT_1065416 [Flammula alnicola]